MVTMWTIWQNVAEAGFTSITASASGCEKSGLSSKVKAKFSGGASIASFGDAWKVGSGLVVIVLPPALVKARNWLSSMHEQYQASWHSPAELSASWARAEYTMRQAGWRCIDLQHE